MNENAHKLIDHVAETDGLVPAIIVFGDRNDDDKMLLSGQVVREDFTKILASAAVFAEIGRPGTEGEVAEIIDAVKTAVSQERPPRPKIVCLCGSTLFWRTFQQAGLQETLAGNIVLSIGAASGTDDEHFGNLPREEYDRVKTMLDELHLRKIDMADEVLILNVNGYIGESTSRELNYAIEKKKQVRFWLAVCSYCGDDLSGKESFIEKNKTFCNEDHFEEWHSAVLAEDAR